MAQNGCKLAHAFLWEHSYKKLKLAQLLGQLSVFLTWYEMSCRAHVGGPLPRALAVSVDQIWMALLGFGAYHSRPPIIRSVLPSHGR